MSARRLLDTLDDDSRAALMAAGTRTHFASGATLAAMDAPAEDVFLILEGFVKVWVRSADGMATLIAVCAAGDLIGEVGVLDGGGRSAQVEAAGPVWCRRIDRLTFLRLLQRYRGADHAVRQAVVARVRAGARRQVDYLTGPARRRLARAVLDLAHDFGEAAPDGVLLSVPLTQEDWAAMTGVTARTVSTAFAQLRDCVQTRYGSLVVTDPARLAAVTHGG